jgi:hypothetical protein
VLADVARWEREIWVWDVKEATGGRKNRRERENGRTGVREKKMKEAAG